jgi:hypothetical protein
MDGLVVEDAHVLKFTERSPVFPLSFRSTIFPPHFVFSSVRFTPFPMILTLYGYFKFFF